MSWVCPICSSNNEDELKYKAAEVFNELGIGLSVAIRMFLVKSIEVGGFPFDCKVNPKEEHKKFFEAVDAMRSKSEQNGNCDLTLEEINQIIAEVRRERDDKKK